MIFTRVVSDDVSERAGARAPRREWRRPRSLPALGMPESRRRRRLATAVSIALHILLIWFLVRPDSMHLNPDLKELDHGNRGNGIEGGGGGGTRGTGGVKFIQVAPQPVTPPPAQSVLPPVVPPKPVVPEPVVPEIELPKLATSDPKPELKVQSPIIGVGGGLGNDGSRGNGPGSGGGIGNGTGTGVGSGKGPGTGAGKGELTDCKTLEALIPPLPVPSNVRGFKLIANYDVDERGKNIKIEFNGTKNGDFNKKLYEVLKGFRWEPHTTLEGVPVRGICQLVYTF